ncbi:MAG TPA: EipA family protein [Allosphingosinicella sp.]|jgi:hypothetical protein
MKQALVRLAAFAALAFAAPGLASAQIQNVDPDTGAAWQPGDAPVDQDLPAPEPEIEQGSPGQGQSDWAPIDQSAEAPLTADQVPPAQTTAMAPPTQTVPRDDVFAAAENVFGDGAEGLAGILEDILKDQGEPIAYISGQEASGAFILGARWGSGVMRHRIEGDRVVYWTGPSIGFDVGADASKVFVLVYNLHDSQQLFRRYPGGEGRAYFVGGFTATYLRRGDVVLIPVRLGVGLRLGVNAGYMRFTERSRWLPF